MKTYVTVTFSSEGGLASEVTDILIDMGFNSALGSHDFVYDWKEKDITPSKAIDFLDKVQKKLKGKNVLLHFTTVK